MSDERPHDEETGPMLPPDEPRRSSAHMRTLLWVLALFVLVLLAPSLVERMQYALTRGRERAEAEVAKLTLADHRLDDISASFGAIAKAVGPSVVHIDTRRVVRQRPDDPFHTFGLPPQRYTQYGQGSGVIVDPAGYILTNNHVVAGASSIDVQFSDGRTLSARDVGADWLTDLALLRVDAGELVAAEWGDSDDLQVGSLVWAVGNPFGLDGSITFGIISAKNRHVTGGSGSQVSNPFQDYLQTDAAVNPGNSGGPLVNIHGKVVGINTMIVGDAYRGVSFAIPSNLAKDVYERLKTTGKVDRGWLGVRLADAIDEILAKKFNLPDRSGALIEEVLRDSPAAAAGLADGDVVVQWNGQEIDKAATLYWLIGRTAIGATVDVVVIRDGQRLPLKVRIGQRPEELKRR